MHRSAIFSTDMRLRYVLTRSWEGGSKMMLWIMLNPSTAAAINDDPSIRRCITFAQDWGYSGMFVVNIFPYRTPYPKNLIKTKMKPGEIWQNTAYIQEYSTKVERVVCAWGNYPILKKLNPDLSWLHQFEKIYTLKVGANNTPTHPLYMRKETKLIRWKPTLNDET